MHRTGSELTTGHRLTHTAVDSARAWSRNDPPPPPLAPPADDADDLPPLDGLIAPPPLEEEGGEVPVAGTCWFRICSSVRRRSATVANDALAGNDDLDGLSVVGVEEDEAFWGGVAAVTAVLVCCL